MLLCNIAYNVTPNITLENLYFAAWIALRVRDVGLQRQ